MEAQYAVLKISDEKERSSMDDIKILIVDDHTVVRDGLSSMLGNSSVVIEAS